MGNQMLVSMSMLVRISPATKNGWSSVLVDAAYAEQLHRHFRALHLSATPIQDAVFRTVRVEQDGGGLVRIITETTDKAFDVQAIPNALETATGQWLKTLK